MENEIKVYFRKNAHKTLNKLSKKDPENFERIKSTIEEIIQNPYDVKYRPVKRYNKYKRAKSGDFRICFKIINEQHIYIGRIKPRENAYN